MKIKQKKKIRDKNKEAQKVNNNIKELTKNFKLIVFVSVFCKKNVKQYLKYLLGDG